MRILDTDVDLILLALAVVPMVWTVRPAPQTIAKPDVVVICHETACYPPPLARPEETGERR